MKVLSACAEATNALIKPKEVKSKIPKCSCCKLNHLAYIPNPNLKKHTHAHIDKDLIIFWPKAKTKLQTKVLPATVTLAPVPSVAQALKGA